MNLALILLAAGDSRRFKGNKLLTFHNGKPMYRYLVDEIAGLPEELFNQKVVVTQYAEIQNDLREKGYLTVENTESHLGISHSIHLGIEALRSQKEPVSYCFSVCDQPGLKAATIKSLINGWRLSGKGLGCLSHHGELGNPVVFSPIYKAELLNLTGDIGGKRILKKHLNDLYLYEVTDGRELIDIDIR